MRLPTPIAPLLLAAAVALSGGAARAQEADDPGAAAPETDRGDLVEPAPVRGPLAVGAQLGVFNGTGVAAQLGTPRAGVRLAVGWAPALVAYTGSSVPGDRASPTLRFYSGVVAAPDLYLRVATSRATSLGVQAGYRYSSVLGSGGAGGIYLQHPIARSVDLLIAGGVLVFPNGEDRLRDREHLASVRFGFPGPNVDLAFSVGLLLFP